MNLVVARELCSVRDQLDWRQKRLTYFPNIVYMPLRSLTSISERLVAYAASHRGSRSVH